MCSMALWPALQPAPCVLPINLLFIPHTLPLIRRPSPPIAPADGTLEDLGQSPIRFPHTLRLHLIFKLCILQRSRLKLSMCTQQIFLETTDLALGLQSERT